MTSALDTQVWRVDPAGATAQTPELAPAVAILAAGGLVAFPTETVYGLGADALSAKAVQGIFRAKGRPADNPLIVHVPSLAAAEELIHPKASRGPLQLLADSFWPGPLTLVVPRRGGVPVEVTAGLDTVGIRVPNHRIALALLRALNRPVAAPSANRSGAPSPTRPEHVWRDLAGRIDGLVDGGPCAVGVESTVLDLSVWPPVLLRPGGVTLEELSAVLGVQVAADPRIFAGAPAEGPVRSPGMKYKHYAPRTPLLLVEQPSPARLLQEAQHAASRGERVGLVVCDETAIPGSSFPVVRLGPRSDPGRIAAQLFHVLRTIDEGRFDLVVVEGIEPKGMGLAVMNRLRRAAGGQAASRI